MTNFFQNVGKVISSAALVFKAGEIVKETSQAAEAVNTLRKNVAGLVTKYREKLKDDIPADIKILLRDLDRVTEETADIANVVNLKSVEKGLRDWIKPEMYS